VKEREDFEPGLSKRPADDPSVLSACHFEFPLQIASAELKTTNIIIARVVANQATDRNDETVFKRVGLEARPPIRIDKECRILP
jgi:hypothetical protein